MENEDKAALIRNRKSTQPELTTSQNGMGSVHMIKKSASKQNALNSHTDTDYGDKTKIPLATSKPVIDTSGSPTQTHQLYDKGMSGQSSAFSDQLPQESFIQSSKAEGMRVIASDPKFDNTVNIKDAENGPSDALPNPFSKYLDIF